MTGITIRLARPGDYEIIGDLTVAAYSAIEDTSNKIVREYLDEMRNVAARVREAEVIVAVDNNDHVLGAVTLVLDTSSELAEWDGDNVGGFRMLAVSPDAQGKGIGRLLTEHCIGRARKVGKDAVLIHSRDVMNNARRIYERMGFVRHPQIDFEVDDIRLEGFRLEL